MSKTQAAPEIAEIGHVAVDDLRRLIACSGRSDSTYSVAGVFVIPHGHDHAIGFSTDGYVLAFRKSNGRMDALTRICPPPSMLDLCHGVNLRIGADGSLLREHDICVGSSTYVPGPPASPHPCPPVHGLVAAFDRRGRSEDGAVISVDPARLAAAMRAVQATEDGRCGVTLRIWSNASAVVVHGPRGIAFLQPVSRTEDVGIEFGEQMAIADEGARALAEMKPTTGGGA